MYKTIEAIYEDGAIIPLNEKIKTHRSRVLITILDSEYKNKNKKSQNQNKFKDFLSSSFVIDNFIMPNRELRNE
jgi:hypothetical protein